MSENLCAECGQPQYSHPVSPELQCAKYVPALPRWDPVPDARIRPQHLDGPAVSRSPAAIGTARTDELPPVPLHRFTCRIEVDPVQLARDLIQPEKVRP